MSIDDMRAALGLGAEVDDVQVVILYGQRQRAAAAIAASAAAVVRDPFARAVDILFNAPGSKPAIYDDGEEDPRDIRVILSMATEDKRYGRVAMVRPSPTVKIRRSDVAEPSRDAIIIVGAQINGTDEGEAYILSGEPIGDAAGLTFTCTIEPQP